MRRPDVQYALSDGTYIAYEVFGAGPVDLVVNLGQGLPFESAWEEPTFTRLLERLGTFSTCVTHDR